MLKFKITAFKEICLRTIVEAASEEKAIELAREREEYLCINADDSDEKYFVYDAENDYVELQIENNYGYVDIEEIEG